MRQNLIQQLVGVQARTISLDDFELWLVAHLDEIIQGRDSELAEQVNMLDALLVQFSEGIVSSVELENTLEDALRHLLTIHKHISVFSPDNSTKSEGTADARSRTQVIMVSEEVQDLRLPRLQIK